jgi:hypothetical protein
MSIELAPLAGNPPSCSTCFRPLVLPERMVGFPAHCYDNAGKGSSRRVQLCGKCLLELLAMVIGV